MPFPPDPATTEWVPLYSKNAFRGADGDPGVAGPAGPQSIGFVLEGEPGEDGMMIPGIPGINGTVSEWQLITTRTMTGLSQEAFTGLAGYSQLAVVGRNVTRSAAALTQWRISTDNGATYPSTSIYGTISVTGTESFGTQYDCFSSAGTGARSWSTYIYSNTASSAKLGYSSISAVPIIINENAAINALLFFASSGTMTGGTIAIYGLKGVPAQAGGTSTNFQPIAMVLEGEPGQDAIMIPGPPGPVGATGPAGSGGGGGGSGSDPWSLVATQAVVAGTAEYDFIDLGDYSEIMVMIDDVVRSTAVTSALFVSTDNGASFSTSTSDYLAIASTGVETGLAGIGFFQTSVSAARSGSIIINAFNVAGAPKVAQCSRTDFATTNIMITGALNAIRVSQSAGTMTSGTIYVWGRRPTVIYPELPFVEPVDADFTWINQGGASVTTTTAGISLTAPANSGQSFRCRVKTAPATPYTITAAFSFNWFLTGGRTQVGGLFFRESATSEIVSLFFGMTSTGVGVKISKNTNETTFSAYYLDGVQGGNWVQFPPKLLWLRIQDNGANRICSISFDGFYFITLHTIGRTDFLTADQVGFFLSEQSNTESINLLLQSWEES